MGTHSRISKTGNCQVRFFLSWGSVHRPCAINLVMHKSVYLLGLNKRDLGGVPPCIPQNDHCVMVGMGGRYIDATTLMWSDPGFSADSLNASLVSRGVPLGDTPCPCEAAGHKRETVHSSGPNVHVCPVIAVLLGGCCTGIAPAHKKVQGGGVRPLHRLFGSAMCWVPKVQRQFLGYIDLHRRRWISVRVHQRN